MMQTNVIWMSYKPISTGITAIDSGQYEDKEPHLVQDWPQGVDNINILHF